MFKEVELFSRNRLKPGSARRRGDLVQANDNKDKYQAVAPMDYTIH